MVQPPFARTGEDSLRPGKNPVVDQRPFDLDAAVVPGAAPVVTPWSIVLDAAVVLIAAAGAAGQTFRFEQDNPKKSSSQSYARYEVYKKTTTFSDLEGLRNFTLPGTKQEVFHGNALTKHGDFANDAAKGFVTFVAATVSPGGFPATAGVDASVADVAKGWVTGRLLLKRAAGFGNLPF